MREERKRRPRTLLPGDGDVGAPRQTFQLRSPWPSPRAIAFGNSGDLAAAGGDVRDDSPVRRSYPSKSFPGGSPARGSGRPRRRGNPNPARPLADRAPPAAENCPSDHGPVYAPRADPHRSQRQWKGRDMSDRSLRANDRAGAPVPRGFRQAACFQWFATSRRGSGRDFRGVFGPFRSISVRDSPAKSGIVRHGWRPGPPAAVCAPLVRPGKSRGAGLTDSRMRPLGQVLRSCFRAFPAAL